jgi:hypothetical protein
MISRDGVIETKINQAKYKLEMGKLIIIGADASESTYELSESTSLVIAVLLIHIESISDRMAILTADDPEGLLLPGLKELDITRRQLAMVRGERDRFACEAAGAEATLKRYTEMVGRVKELLSFAIDQDQQAYMTLEGMAGKVKRMFVDNKAKDEACDERR